MSGKGGKQANSGHSLRKMKSTSDIPSSSASGSANTHGGSYAAAASGGGGGLSSSQPSHSASASQASRPSRADGGQAALDSVECCLKCHGSVLDSDNAVLCQSCKGWIHQNCANISAQEYRMMNRSSPNLMWFCNDCQSKVSVSVKNGCACGSEQSVVAMQNLIYEMVKKIDALTSHVMRLEKASNKVEDIDALVEEKVKKYMEESRDQAGRERNVILHNVPESHSDEVKDRVAHDFEQTKLVLQHLNVPDAVVVDKPVRLGKRGGGKPRLMRISFADKNAKKSVLSHATKLRESSDAVLRNVYVTPDLTYQQRVANKKLRDELQRRKDAGESNLKISRGQIVQTDPAFRHAGPGTRK